MPESRLEKAAINWWNSQRIENRLPSMNEVWKACAKWIYKETGQAFIDRMMGPQEITVKSFSGMLSEICEIQEPKQQKPLTTLSPEMISAITELNDKINDQSFRFDLQIKNVEGNLDKTDKRTDNIALALGRLEVRIANLESLKGYWYPPTPVDKL